DLRPRPGRPRAVGDPARRADRLRRVPALPAPLRPRRAAAAAGAGRDAAARVHARAGAGVPAHLRALPRVLGGLRDLRGAGGPRGELPAVALPPPQDGGAHDRHRAGHRRVERGRVPAQGPRPDVLPRAVRRPHGDPRTMTGTRTWAERAADADATDPLARLRARFLPAPGVVAYLDGNSLGRPVADAANRLDEFVHHAWAQRLIRGWTEEGTHGPWMEWPERVGDRIAALALGAAPGQTVLADSTTVLLYKLARAAVDAAIDEDPRRRVIVAFADDFPTDRYVVEGIAAECGGSVRWLHADIAAGVTADQVARAVAPDTALVLLSHVVYRSGWLTDAPAVAEAAHAAGAYVLL